MDIGAVRRRNKRQIMVLIALVAIISILTGCVGKRKKVAPPPAPLAPSDLTTHVGPTMTYVGLHWEDNSNNEQGFYIYRSSTGSYTKIASGRANYMCYRDEEVIPGMNYCYKVTAYNEGGESPPSNVACVTMPG